MALELRGGVRAAPVAGRSARERQALRFAPDPPRRGADPEHVARTARENEEDGLDSALVVQSSSWPDPWLVATWALAATQRLRLAVAHRIGTTAPTVAARTLATLDGLSRGRASAHVILGSSDADVWRDGDPLGKPERYQRAGEYLEVFHRTLTEPEPFDFEGRYYTLRGAFAGVRPPAGRRGLISFGGSSGMELAARYADVYALSPQPLEDTRQRIHQARRAAAAHGRELRFWRHVSFVLGTTDEAARERAGWAGAEAVRLASGPLAHQWRGAVQLDRDPERPPASAPGDHGSQGPGQAHAAAVGPGRGTSDAEAADRLRAFVRRTVAGAVVGSPATAAAQVAPLVAAGVDILQIDTAVETGDDRALRRELVERLRDGTARCGTA